MAVNKPNFKNMPDGDARRKADTGIPAGEKGLPDIIARIGRNGEIQSIEGPPDALFQPATMPSGQRIADRLPQETAVLFMAGIEAALTSTKLQYIEFSAHIDGDRQFYKARIVPEADSCALVILSNFTEQRQAQDRQKRDRQSLEALVAARTSELGRAETEYRNIFHHSGSPSILVDPDYTISMANPKFEELTGFSRHEIEGRMKWIDFIADEDRKMVRRYHAARRKDQGLAPSEYECRIVDRHGAARHIFIKVGMLSEPGRTIASLIDITSLKETEQDLRNREALYSGILTGYEGVVYFIGMDYTIRFMNENLIAQIGRDATGEKCFKAIHQRNSKCLWCVSDQVFQGQTVRFEMKNPNDGKWYRSVNVPVKLSDGVTYCQAMVTDIDEQKRLEETLRNSEAHLREENLRLRSTIEDRHKFGDIVGKQRRHAGSLRIDAHGRRCRHQHHSLWRVWNRQGTGGQCHSQHERTEK